MQGLSPLLEVDFRRSIMVLSIYQFFYVFALVYLYTYFVNKKHTFVFHFTGVHLFQDCEKYTIY